MKFFAPLLIVLSLTGCAEAQQTSEQIQVHNGADKISAEAENSTDLKPQAKTDLILEELKSLARQYYDGEREQDWIATLDDFNDFGLTGIDDENVLAFATENKNKALKLFLRLKGQDEDFDDYIDYIKAASDLEKSKADLEKSKADLEYITNLAESLEGLEGED